MDLQHLPDIHTGRYAQRVQHDVQRPSVRQERHILHRQHPGYNTLVSVTSGHLVTHRDLSLLCDVDAHGFIDARRQLVAVLSCKYFGVYHDTIFSMRHLERGVSYFSCLLAEDGPKEPLFRGQLGLTLRRYLTYQDISCAHLCADADDSSLIQVLEGVVAHTRDITGDLFRSQLGVTGFRLVLLDVDRCIDIVLHQSLA